MPSGAAGATGDGAAAELGQSSSDPQVQLVLAEDFQVYGARSVWRQLKCEGFDIASCAVPRLMNTKGLKGVIRDKSHPAPPSDNSAPCLLDQVKRNLKASVPSMRECSDCTDVAPHACRYPLRLRSHHPRQLRGNQTAHLRPTLLAARRYISQMRHQMSVSLRLGFVFSVSTYSTTDRISRHSLDVRNAKRRPLVGGRLLPKTRGREFQ